MRLWDEWQRDCLLLFKQYMEVSIYGPGEVTLDESEADNNKVRLVEFSENGDAYLHGIGGVTHIPGVVLSFDSWKETKGMSDDELLSKLGY